MVEVRPRSTRPRRPGPGVKKALLVVGVVAAVLIVPALVSQRWGRPDPPAPQAADAPRLDDLARPAGALLRSQPEVARVEVLVRRVDRSLRVVHLRSWHFVPEAAFALDVRAASKEPLSDREVQRLYEEHLRAVERVE